MARIELEKDERQIFFDTKVLDMIAEELRRLGFKYVTLIIEGYNSGSMLLHISRARRLSRVDKKEKKNTLSSVGLKVKL
uniref:Uncharacterized protein n=1 Tax=Fervidicoccus fontis TaxID=683846 RepID=A0A7J3SMD8_9CREN